MLLAAYALEAGTDRGCLGAQSVGLRPRRLLRQARACGRRARARSDRSLAIATTTGTGWASRAADTHRCGRTARPTSGPGTRPCSHQQVRRDRAPRLPLTLPVGHLQECCHSRHRTETSKHGSLGLSAESELLAVGRQRKVSVVACAGRQPVRAFDPFERPRLHRYSPQIPDLLRQSFEIQVTARLGPHEIAQTDTQSCDLSIHVGRDR